MMRSVPSALRRVAVDEAGNAPLEFLAAGVLLLVPLVYLVLALSSVQSATLATEGAARQAARVFVTADDATGGRAAAGTAIEVALSDAGIAEPEAVAIDCGSTRCLTPPGLVTVRVGVDVPLPLLPAFIGGIPLTVPVEASATERFSRFAVSGAAPP